VTADYESIRAHQHAVEQVIPLLEAIRSVAEIAYRRAEAGLPSLAQYAARIDAQLADLNAVADGAFAGGDGEARRSVLVVVSSERGLCGGFNQRLVDKVRAELRQKRSAGEEVLLVTLGSRGLRLLDAAGEAIVHSTRLPSFAMPSYLEVERAAVEILDLMEERSCERLLVMHNAPRHQFQYEVASRQLFPVEPAGGAIELPAVWTEVKPAEDVDELFTHLVTERVLIDLYQAVVESAVSEELARVAAMRLATDNARGLLESLSLEANRARQASETNALLEIIGGFEAASLEEAT
jgi:F-type H+-transporting ATPase subunit gamma